MTEIETLRAENAQLIDALHEAVLQIEYLQNKFMPTGSGNAVLARLKELLNDRD